MPTLHNEKLISANFEQKNFAHFLKRFADFRANFFCSKSAEMKILLCNVAMGNKLYEIIFLINVLKIEAYEANSPLQKKFCDFSQRGYFFGFY